MLKSAATGSLCEYNGSEICVSGISLIKRQIYYYDEQGLDEELFNSVNFFLFFATQNQNQFTSRNWLFRKLVVIFFKIKISPNPYFRPFVTQYTNPIFFLFWFQISRSEDIFVTESDVEKRTF